MGKEGRIRAFATFLFSFSFFFEGNIPPLSKYVNLEHIVIFKTEKTFLLQFDLETFSFVNTRLNYKAVNH